ncbi:MAG: DUF3667 domain-containing protein [Mameliella sp.]|nr:DUF3667 domain-containing protein [Phaeodactylibacter sp.]
MSKPDTQIDDQEGSGDPVDQSNHTSVDSTKLNRIDGQYIISEIRHVLNFDKGILFTIKALLLRPGKSIRVYINEDRSKLVKPILFLIVCSLAYMLAQGLLNFEEDYATADALEAQESAVTAILTWMKKNYGYANIIMAFFIAPWVKVFFRKQGYNIFEILILLFYVMGIGMLIFTAFGIGESLTGIKMFNIGGSLGFVYAGWAIARFYDKRSKLSYLKGFLAYIIGMVTAFGVAISIGNLIDWITA